MLLLAGSMQAQGGFNPVNPDEPQTPVIYYALTAACDPDGAGTTCGKGSYAPGTTVTVRTSPRTGYTFLYWSLNGEQYSTNMSFTYTTVEGFMDFVAHYQLTPDNPAEPYMDVKSRLWLESVPEGICTFNRTSGALVTADQPVTVSVTGTDQWYEFEGWYKDGLKVSGASSFQYTPDYEDATLVARFEEITFNPGNPDEPQLDYVLGDVDKNGQREMADVRAMVNIILGSDCVRPYQYNHEAADVNNDGDISLADVTTLVNLLLNR